MNRLAAYEKRVFSQNGEDGVIEEIFNSIGTTNKIFVEFGVEDGTQCNTAKLAREEWAGLMIEGSEYMFSSLRERYANSSINTMNRFITVENIVSIFEEAGIPIEFDLLSVDIDGNDYWVWEKISKQYKPRVVVIEYNAFYAPPQKWVMKYNPNHIWDATTYQGASLHSLYLLGKKYGYSLIGTESMGVNAFFLRDDLIASSGFLALDSESAYHKAGYSGGFGHPYRDGEFVEI